MPASDSCRALCRCLNFAQRFDYRALGSSRNLGRTAEHLIDGSVKRICPLSLNFRVRMKGAVNAKNYLLTIMELPKQMEHQAF